MQSTEELKLTEIRRDLSHTLNIVNWNKNSAEINPKAGRRWTLKDVEAALQTTIDICNDCLAELEVEKLQEVTRELYQYKAARQAYANELGCEVGDIHETIRKWKQHLKLCTGQIK
jgi:FtsZ-binding cell division protein ZapB